MNATRNGPGGNRTMRHARPRHPPLPRKYIGPRWFGRAHAAMMRGDSHGVGSIDRQLQRMMIGLDSGSSDYLYRDYSPTRSSYREGARPVLDAIAQGVASTSLDPEVRVRAIARFVSRLQPAPPIDLDSFRVGGTEEEIIARGSDWCTDTGRVACALLQVAGLPSRMVFLADTHRAYSGHAIVETYRRERWGAVDPLTDVVYLSPDGLPATTWDLMVHPDWIDRHYRGRSTYFTRRGQFRTAAVSNYRLGRREEQDYSVTKVNPYYRSILRMSDRRWPGGLRWLHGEDRPSPSRGRLCSAPAPRKRVRPMT